ncbi:MAG: glycosyltransferase [Schwartzia sp.]|nr:glycosyltransferase [Schwartzia sp. (in: firmicutes)]
MSAKRREREPSQPVVSVLIPVFNAEKFLAPALDSVLGQSLHEIEIICADDGSTDGSAAILAEYAAKDSRLRVVTAAENGGLPAARNLAFSEARGRYAYFFDADDLLPTDALKRLAQVMDEDSLDGVLFETSPIFENEELRARYENDRFYRRRNVYEGVFSGPQLYIETLTRGDYIPMAWLQMWRADFLRREGLLYCTLLGKRDDQEDDLFYYQAMLRAKRVRCLHEEHHIYRRHGASISAEERGVSLHARVVVYCERVRALGEASPSIPAKLRAVYEDYMHADYRELCRLYQILGDIGADAFRNSSHRLFYRSLQYQAAAWGAALPLIRLPRRPLVCLADRASAPAAIRLFGFAPEDCVELETEAKEIKLKDLFAALRPGSLHLFCTWGYEAMRDALAEKGLREGEDFMDARPLLRPLADASAKYGERG